MRRPWSILPLFVALLACKQLSSNDEKKTPSASGAVTAESAPAPPAKKNPVGGLWQGKFKSQRFAGSVIGLVTEDGKARFVTYGGVQMVGSVEDRDGKLSGTLVGYENHRAGDTVTLEGDVVEGKSLKGTFKGQKDRGSFELSYGPEYDRPVTLAELADQWGAVSFAMKINDKGLFEGKDARGCTYTGAFTLAHEGYNAFNLSFSVADCKYKGEYKGLATVMDKDGARSQLAYGVSGDNYSRAGVLFRGELLGSAKAQEAIRKAQKAHGEAVKAVGQARKARKAAEAQKARKAAEGILKGF